MSDKTWNVNHIPAQTGKTIIITGATSGIGFEAALALAAAGAEVVIASRNPSKGAAILSKIRQICPDARVNFMILDTSSQISVRSFCDSWLSSHKKIDTLILNAGISNVPSREETVDGFERQLATNYLGHFAMTARLLPSMNGSAGARTDCPAGCRH